MKFPHPAISHASFFTPNLFVRASKCESSQCVCVCACECVFVVVGMCAGELALERNIQREKLNIH